MRPQIDEPTRRVSVRVESAGEGLMTALRSLEDSGVELEDIAMRQPNLDEVFLVVDRPADRLQRLDGGQRPPSENRKEKSK